MQHYQRVCLVSRGYDPDFVQTIPCDICNKPAVDIDHLNYGGKTRKTHLLDPLNLQPVCRNCHTNKGNRQEKARREQIIYSKVLKKYGGNKS